MVGCDLPDFFSKKLINIHDVERVAADYKIRLRRQLVAVVADLELGFVVFFFII